MVEVTQEDQEAAWLFRPVVIPHFDRDDWSAGLYDDGIEIIQAFARHRIVAEQRGKLEGGALFRKAIEDAIGYVQGQIGCSYCETSQADWDFMHELEDLLGVPRTDKKSFYY